MRTRIPREPSARCWRASMRARPARPQLAAEFATDAIFFDIRLEPYLLATAARHPDLAPRDRGAGRRRRRRNTRALVHGDVSPKNILVGAEGPVLLDAECAWWGDPAFDLAFCLNHLLLKCLWTAAPRAALPRVLRGLSRAYLAASIGSRPRRSSSARRACCPVCCSRASTASRRSSTSPTRPTRERVRRVGAAARRPPVVAGGDRHRPGLVELASMTISGRHPRRRVWDARPADGRGRADAARTARSGGPSPRPAPRRGTREAVDLRDGGAALRRPRRAAARSAASNGEIAPALVGVTPRDQAGDRRAPDRARRHAEQVTPRRQRDDRDVDGRCPRRPRRSAAAALAIPRRAASAVACRCRRSRSSAAARMPGGASTCRTSWWSAPVRAASREALEWTAEVYRCAGALMHRARAVARRRRRGRLVAGLRAQRGGARGAGAGDRARRLVPGDDVAIALDIAASAVRPRRPVPTRARAAGARLATPCASGSCAGSTAIRSSRSRTRWRRTTQTGFVALHARRRREGPGRRRRLSRHRAARVRAAASRRRVQSPC